MSSTALISKPTIAVQIQTLMDEHQMDEFKNFISRRSYLNKCNLFLIYFFHLIQSAGILTTTIATGYNMPYLIWVGVGLNIFASLLNVYEKNNADIIKKLKEEMDHIREGKPVEEPVIEDVAEAPPAPVPAAAPPAPPPAPAKPISQLKLVGTAGAVGTTGAPLDAKKA
jgi:hypothetical protein